MGARKARAAPGETHASVVAMFERQAGKTPGRTAVVYQTHELTYGALNARADAVAQKLAALGIGPETLVGIAVDRSPEMVVALLGILKAGAAYVPLDPAYPQERLSFMLEDAAVSVLIVRDEVPFDAGTCPILRLDAIGYESGPGRARTDEEGAAAKGGSAGPGDGEPLTDVDSHSLAYVIYTSGSSGRPKGVEIEHRSLANFLDSMRDAPGLTENDVLLAVTSISFDIAALEIFLPLVVGARLALTSAEVVRDAVRLMDAIDAVGATVVQATPTTWQLLVSGGWKGDPDLKILSGGEPLSRKLAGELLERGKSLWNLYGPTETTVWSTLCEVRDLTESLAIGVGRPIANTSVYVMAEGARAERTSRLPAGQTGELCIGGAGVARGYLNQPGLTSEKFVPDPFGDDPSARLYRTGDLGRELADGQFEVLGRLDRQLKIRGMRVEPEEIEAEIAKHSSVENCVVVAHPKPNGAPRLVAYLVMRQDPAEAPLADRTSQWQEVWSQAYQKAPADERSDLRAAGWNDSITGLPMAEGDVLEWADHTAARIVAQRPQRLLEVGCGNGILLRRVAPECARYVGIDITPEAVRNIQEELKSEPRRWSHVEVRQGSADAIDDILEGGIDAVVINSVIQYFPNVDYAVRVLQTALEKTAPGGFVFVGDVRSLPLLEAFHASVELARGSASLTTPELRQRIQQSVRREKELVLDPEFFRALARRIPNVSSVDIQLKRGVHANELNRFRYDVTFRVGGRGTSAISPRPRAWTDWRRSGLDLTRLSDWLSLQEGDAIGIAGIPNARVARELAAIELVASARAPGTLAGVVEAVRDAAGASVDPEDLWAASRGLGFDVSCSWTPGEPGLFDATFVRRSAKPDAVEAMPPAPHPDEARPWLAYANDPSLATRTRHLAREMRAFLRQRLPESFIPSNFVAIDRLPQAPGGKLDTSALAAAESAPQHRHHVPVAARDATEQRLVEIWRDVLGQDEIGVDDDFFDLGGDSLLAVEVVTSIARVFRKNISLASIFGTRGLTIAKQATIIRPLTDAARDRVSIVPLQIHGTRPPLFFASTPMNLVRHMHPDQPIYEVSIPAVHGRMYDLQVLDPTVEQCIEAIRSVQPRGPYYLGGNCYGGLLMLETALRLEAMRDEVALLILVDPDPEDDVPIAARIVHHLRDLNGLSTLEKASVFRKKTGSLVNTLRRMIAGPSREESDYASLHRARWRDSKWSHPFPTALFLSRPRYDAPQANEMSSEGWEKRSAPDFVVFDLPGDRTTSFSEAHLPVAAQRLTRCLDLARQSR